MRCEPCDRAFPLATSFCGICGSELTGAESAKKKEIFSPPENTGPGVYGFLYGLKEITYRFTLTEGDNTIGAGGNNDIRIPRPAVSWNHAILICREKRVLVQDSASTNGTFLNGKSVRQATPLEHDDQLRFGTEEFRIWLLPELRE